MRGVFYKNFMAARCNIGRVSNSRRVIQGKRTCNGIVFFDLHAINTINPLLDIAGVIHPRAARGLSTRPSKPETFSPRTKRWRNLDDRPDPTRSLPP